MSLRGGERESRDIDRSAVSAAQWRHLIMAIVWPIGVNRGNDVYAAASPFMRLY